LITFSLCVAGAIREPILYLSLYFKTNRQKYYELLDRVRTHGDRNTLWFQPLFGGLLVGIMGWFVPQSLGVGYSCVGDALNGGIALQLMLSLLVLKLIGVTTSYASGNAGGIFGPSLFIGAMLGGGLGNCGAQFISEVRGCPWCICLGRYGRSICRDRASAHDFRGDDL